MKLQEDLIRTMLYRKHISQTELSVISGVSRVTIVSVCNGKSCSATTALKIADALGVKLDDIIMRD